MRTHYFIKLTQGWIVSCKNTDKQFRPRIFDTQGHGRCPYCAEEAEQELENNKIKRNLKECSVQQRLQ